MKKGKKLTWLLLSLGILLAAAGCREPIDQSWSSIPSAASVSTAASQTALPTQTSENLQTGSAAATQTEPTAVSTQSLTQPTTEPPTQQTHEPTVLPMQETTQPQTQAATQPTAEPTQTPTQPIPDDPAIPQKMTVEASGIFVKQSGDAVIDYSNTADGYVMARYAAATERKLKVQVKGPSTTYTYNLTPGRWVAFPLSDENGDYKVTVYENVTGTRYAALVSVSFTAQMSDEFAPFLRSNQYVDFDTAPNTVAKAAALTAGITDPLKKVEAVYDFVVSGMTYDQELAASVTSGYLPVLDEVLSKMKGICFDYAALMTGMLRSQGVPAKLVVGYAGEVYHAWISVWSENTGWVDGVIFFDGASWQRMDPTFASGGGSSPDILDYIGDGSNYTAKYFY